MKDDIAKELLEPLVDAYALTDAERERVRAKLRERLGGTVFVGTASTATSWLTHRHVLGAIAGIAGIATVVALGTGSSNTSTKESSPLPQPAVSLATSPAPAVTSEPVGEPAAEQVAAPTVAVDALPSVVAPAAVVPPATRAGAARHADGDDDLVRETRLMAKANEVMRSGDLRGALALFDQHAREFPRGVLGEERAVSRVVILCRLDRRDEATREGQRFLQTHPPSPLTRRIESSCAGRGEAREGDSP